MPYIARLAPFLCLGRSSLLAFTLGTCLLDFWPRYWRLPVATGFLASALVPPLVMCLVLLVDARVLERIPARATPAGVPPALPKLR